MRRYLGLSLAAAAAVGFAGTAWSQGGQGGGAAGGGAVGGSAAGGGGVGATGVGAAGAAGSAGAGAANTGVAGANTGGAGSNAGSAGAGANPGSAGAGSNGAAGNAGGAPAAGGVGTAGNGGANNGSLNGNNGGNNGLNNRGNLGNAGTSGRTNAGQNRTAANANRNGLNNNAGGINQRPFFSDPGARRQLNMNENQFNALNRAYQNAYGQYNNGVSGLGNNRNLSAQQRSQQMQQFQNQFNTSFNREVDSAITDPQARARFDQLNRQYAGLNSFNDPAIQSQLNLTPQQQLQIRRLATKWQNQLDGNGTTANNMTQQQWSQMYSQYGDQLTSIFTPQQRQTWSQLTGESYTFPYELYSPQSGSAAGPNQAAGAVSGYNSGSSPSSGSTTGGNSTSPSNGTVGGAPATGTGTTR